MPDQEEKKILSLAEAQQIMQKIDVEKADQIQKRTIDYAAKFSKVTADVARRMRKQLESDCGLSSEESAEVVNNMPKSIEEIRTFTAGWKKLLPTETLEKMRKILDSGQNE